MAALYVAPRAVAHTFVVRACVRTACALRARAGGLALCEICEHGPAYIRVSTVRNLVMALLLLLLVCGERASATIPLEGSRR